MASDFNLSEWALRNRPLVLYAMLVLAIIGYFSYQRLGQSEDPPFTFKAMVVRTDWPGHVAQKEFATSCLGCHKQYREQDANQQFVRLRLGDRHVAELDDLGRAGLVERARRYADDSALCARSIDAIRTRCFAALGKLGREGGMGGEFYTPRSVVRMMVEMLDPPCQ